MLNVMAGTLASDPIIKTIDTAKGRTNVANTTIYVRTSKDRSDIPVKITAWADEASDLSKYKKGESVHFIGSPTANPYKSAAMENPIITMGFTVIKIDTDKTLLKQQDEILKAYMKGEKEKERPVEERGKEQKLQKEAKAPEKPKSKTMKPMAGPAAPKLSL